MGAEQGLIQAEHLKNQDSQRNRQVRNTVLKTAYCFHMMVKK